MRPFWLRPVWQCALRPFFIAATVTALVSMLWWLGGLALSVPLPPAAVPLGPTLWHAQGLLMGMGLAATAGFVLTAVPEFTATPAFAARRVRQLAGLWLLGWIGSTFIPGPVGQGAAVLLGWGGLMVGLIALVLPRIARDPGRPHLGLAWALAGVAVCVIGAGVDQVQGRSIARWLQALLELDMVLIVVAMSRISMRVVNRALDEQRRARPRVDLPVYLARPPRRHLAVTFMSAHALVQWAGPGRAEAGWLALAAAAAMLHLMSDWHVGRALGRRWPLMLYAVYLFEALGYALMGGGTLAGDAGVFSAGRHLLAIGGFGLGIAAVMVIAGSTHSGVVPSERAWVPAAMGGIGVAALLRAAAGWPEVAWTAWILAAGAWVLAFGLLAWRLLPVWWRPRRDGLSGCEEPVEEGAGC